MTIHKSQGSEFDKVLIILPEKVSPIMTRELLYTALTRAKTKVTIIASEQAIIESIKRPIARASGLRSLLS